jgi:ATP synthase protein I
MVAAGGRTRPLRPLLVVFAWQIAAITALAALSGGIAGTPAALSAILGGAVAVAGGLVFALFIPRGPEASPLAAISRMVRAEAAKVGAIVLLLWLVLKLYKDAVIPALIGTFILAVIIFSMAVFVRNPVLLDTDNNHVD